MSAHLLTGNQEKYIRDNYQNSSIRGMQHALRIPIQRIYYFMKREGLRRDHIVINRTKSEFSLIREAVLKLKGTMSARQIVEHMDLKITQVNNILYLKKRDTQHEQLFNVDARKEGWLV